MDGAAALPAEPDRHAWERMEPGWHVGFALFLAAACALLLFDGPRPARPLSFVLVAAVGVAYTVAGGPALHRPDADRRGGWYLAVAVPSVLALFASTPIGAVLLFALFPQIWRLLPTRAAVMTSVATMLGIGGVQLATADPADRVQILAWTAGTIVCSVLLGLWITRIAAQSMHRARLVDELERTRAALADSHREAGALAERERLAHDTLAQGFTSLLLLVRTMQDEIDTDPAAARRHLALAARTAQDNLAEARTLIDTLSPAALTDAPLSAALRRLVDGAVSELGIQGELAVTGTERALPATHAVALLRVAQEAIANVRKHAGAGRLRPALCFSERSVTLRVTDDGCGFVTGIGATIGVTAGSGGFGLGGMRSRVAELGGELRVCSAPGRGTTVEITLDDAASGSGR